jgi:predicted nucleotidyltransferase
VNARTPALEVVARVARHLGELGDSMAFLGGAIVDLLLTDPAAPPTRATRDVDLIVEIASRREYWALQRDLENRGFMQDEDGGVICRWIVAGIQVDVMPTDPQILGFSNRWYAPAVRTAQTHPLDDVRVRVVTAPYFVATKLEAFADPERGAGAREAWVFRSD